MTVLLNIAFLSIYQYRAAAWIKYTVNGERFAGLNFCIFHGFQEYRKSFSVNISAFFICTK